jgi:hypothetical protein
MRERYVASEKQLCYQGVFGEVTTSICFYLQGGITDWLASLSSVFAGS